jgi:hypothetical protein
MVDSSDISRRSEGAPAIDRLAAEFGISTDAANAAVDALVPGIAAGIRTQAMDPAGFVSLLGLHGPGRPLAAFGDPSTLPMSDAERDATVAKAAAATGLAPDLLSKMLPVLGSLVVSAIVNAIQAKGLGGLGSILGQILGGGRAEASSVPPQGSPSGSGGGIDLGSILEQVLKGGQGQASPVPPQGSPSGSGGGIDLGSILEQVLKGGQGQASPVPPQGSPSGPGGGIDLGTILEQVLKGGLGRASPTLPGEPERPRSGLEDEIGKILRGTRT